MNVDPKGIRRASSFEISPTSGLNASVHPCGGDAPPVGGSFANGTSAIDISVTKTADATTLPVPSHSPSQSATVLDPPPVWSGYIMSVDPPPFYKAGRDYAVPQYEAAMLSLIINFPSRIRSLVEDLSSEHFFDEHNLALFAAILRVHSSGGRVSSSSLLRDLAETEGINSQDWECYISAMAGVRVQLDDATHYKRHLNKAVAVRGGEEYSRHKFNENFCADLVRTRLPPVRCVGEKWFSYGEGVWKQENRHSYRSLARECIHPEQRQARRIFDVLSNVESAAQAQPDFFCGAHKFAGDIILLNANNGVIEITPPNQIVFRSHDSVDGFTLKLTADYDPEAECSAFQHLLAGALPDPHDQELLQTFAGSILYPSCSYETALVCFGDGATGKSTVAEGIRLVLGSDLCGSLGLEDLCDSSSYALPGLKHKMLNLGSELKGTEVNESSAFKKLVSGEFLNVRRIYNDPEEMVTTTKLMFLSNHLPRFRSGTDAEIRRLRMLYFQFKPDEPDLRLKQKLAQETAGILNWMVQGLLRLLEQDFFPFGGFASSRLLGVFASANDPVGSFITACCKAKAGHEIAKSDLVAGFTEWCELNGIVIDPKNIDSYFFKTLRSRMPNLRYIRRRTNTGTPPDRGRFIVGLRLHRKMLKPITTDDEITILQAMSVNPERPLHGFD